MRDIQKQIGRRIRALRKKAGLTISQLAEAADLSDNYVGFVERGVRAPRIRTLAKLASALNVEIADFFYFPDETSNKKEQVIKDILYQLKNKNTEGIEFVSKIIKDVLEFSYSKRKKKKNK
jgi:transcriptional regulator with XRE-family HTH domain